MIGKTINRYEIIGNINNRVVMAHNPNAVEPWVVWWLDSDGDCTVEECTHYTNKECHIKEDLWTD